MKIPKALSALFLTIMTTTIAIGAEEKMTYEKAMASHKATYGKYSTQSITEAQSQKSWDDYKQKPDISPSGANSVISRKYKLIWQAPTSGGINTGNFTLTESFRTFDEIVSFGTMDNGNYYQHFRFTPLEYDIAVERKGYATMYERDSVSWWGKFAADNKSFVTAGENAKLYEIYGVTFTSDTSDTSGSCTSGQTQTRTTYCSGSNLQTCEPGEDVKTCSAAGFWGTWQISRPPSCVTGTQQCR